MKIKTGLLLILTTLASACATKDIPDNVKEINQACSFEMQAARTAVRLRDKGKTREDLLAKLVPIDKDSSRLLIEMHEITHEVFDYPLLNDVVYSTYRFELCQRELLRKPVPASLEAVLPMLQQCQQHFGDQSSVKGTTCILDAVKNQAIQITNKPNS